MIVWRGRESGRPHQLGLRQPATGTHWRTTNVTSGCVRVGTKVWLPPVVGALAGFRAQEVDCLGREPPGGAELRRDVQGASAGHALAVGGQVPAGAVRVAMGGAQPCVVVARGRFARSVQNSPKRT